MKRESAQDTNYIHREKLDFYYHSNWCKNVVKSLENYSYRLTIFFFSFQKLGQTFHGGREAADIVLYFFSFSKI